MTTDLVYPTAFRNAVWSRKPSSVMDDRMQIRVNLTFDERQLVIVLSKTSKSKNLQITKPSEYKSEGEATVIYDWEPQTTMHDFEIIDPSNYFVNRGAGIGVLIVDCLDTYIKLVRDSSKPQRVHVIWTSWRSKHGNEKPRRCMDDDLWNGYDICYLAGDRASRRFNLRLNRLLSPTDEGHVLTQEANDYLLLSSRVSGHSDWIAPTSSLVGNKRQNGTVHIRKTKKRKLK